MKTAFLLALASACCVATSIQAHHTFAMFDAQKERTLVGTVREFQYTNPHGMLQLEVTTKSGNTQEWSIEFGSTTVMRRQGLGRDTFKSGDKITAIINPLRNGTTGGSFQRAILADGTLIDAPQVRLPRPSN
ncbi:MAG: DUF6152 family protein [Steroidobacteraceae bacterium]